MWGARMSDKQLYRLHRNMYTGDLFGNWIGTNNDGMSSDSGMFEFVFVPVEPDHEAAMTEMHRLRWAETNDGPYAERFGYAYVEGVKVYKISDFDTACRIVDAALGLGGDV